MLEVTQIELGNAGNALEGCMKSIEPPEETKDWIEELGFKFICKTGAGIAGGVEFEDALMSLFSECFCIGYLLPPVDVNLSDLTVGQLTEAVERYFAEQFSVDFDDDLLMSYRGRLKGMLFTPHPFTPIEQYVRDSISQGLAAGVVYAKYESFKRKAQRASSLFRAE